MTINSFIGRATPRQCAPSQFLVIRRSQEMGDRAAPAQVGLLRMLLQRDAQLLRRANSVKSVAEIQGNSIWAHHS